MLRLIKLTYFRVKKAQLTLQIQMQIALPEGKVSEIAHLINIYIYVVC